MELMTKEHRAQLLANGQAMAKTDISNTVQPVVKLFMPDGAATWLLAWLEPEDMDIAWGLCCLGMGCPEVGPYRRLMCADDISLARGRYCRSRVHPVIFNKCCSVVVASAHITTVPPGVPK